MSLTAPSANIARHLSEMAAHQPHVAALKVPRGRTSAGNIDYLVLSFRELDIEVEAWCERLLRAGIRRGDRTLVMVRQGLPLIASAFALFKIGAVPIIIDPGMGLKSFLACVEHSRPRALLGITLAQLVSRFARRAFSSVAVRVTVSGSLTARIAEEHRGRADHVVTAACPAESTDLAAVLFTSGSTGRPKGVCYEHGMFEAQIRAIRDTYGITPGEIDLPMLPIFALFNPALGMTTIVPEIDPRHPADVDPAKIVQAIQQENVSNSFGSPTLWRKIGDHCLRQNITLPTLRRVLCAGAPVPSALWQGSHTWMPAGLLHSPYGATEALPVSSVSSAEIALLKGVGACVGRSASETRIKIIPIQDVDIPALEPTHELGVNEIGEIIVSGPTVTKSYDATPAATAAAKIIYRRDPNAPMETWHRMGDCGYIDAEGHLWFCGRKIERVETPNGTLFTEPCEQVFREHPNVVRCALIGLGAHGNQRAALVVETKLTTTKERAALAEALRLRAKTNALTSGITCFFFHHRFPVDVRHNAKIHRLALARWANSARGYEVAS